MQFFINSEKYLSTAEELSVKEIIKMAGYPVDRDYKVINEKLGTSYNGDDIISLHNNLSLMIKHN